MNKYYSNEEKIKNQKKENEKKINDKYLEIAIKREDINKNLIRYERQKELKRQKKFESLGKRSEKLEEIQRQKNEINNIKRELSNNVLQRKNELLKKVKNIISEGSFTSKDDIYLKVFNNEELGLLGKNRYSIKNTKMNKTQDNPDTFFLTQGSKNNDDKNEGS